MAQALYRKYRSKKLSEIVGQEHITTTLANALKKGAISHAYLFTGPRGVGKTSVARILAHEVNGLSYDEDSTHLDIIEIDAASNRRIDEIRELRDKVHNAPTSAKYKVYIIDEVHMLTKEAFNALLKTLEEPPEHAIFILATTEAHKVPETIISRTQRFTFKPIDTDQAVERLTSIAKQESIDINKDALRLIAEHSGGSFRDSISLLDQVQSRGTKITVVDVEHMLGFAPEAALATLIKSVSEGSANQVVGLWQQLQSDGYQAPQLSRQLSEKLRQLLIEGNGPWTPESLTRLLERLLDVSASHNPAALLELILLEATLEKAPAITSSKPQKAPSIETQAKAVSKSLAKDSKNADLSVFDDNAWQQVLQVLKQKHPSLYGVARMAVPEFHDKELVLKFGFEFHRKRFNEDKNQQLIIDIIKQQTGLEPIITCIVDKDSAGTIIPANIVEDIPNEPLETINNIFGGGEVIES